jgi:isoleucyl-tRNA synthetase
LDRVTDIYRRLRNTLRFSLGALHGFSQKEMVPVSSMGILERMIHHRLYVLDQQIHESMEQYDFQAIVQMIYDFCNQDLSAFYFDISKDSLYCDDENSPLRQQIRTTLWHVLIHVVHWLAPFIPFTAEESWTYLAKDVLGIDPAASSNDWSASNGLLDVLRGMGLVDDVWSIHLNQMPRAPESWHDPVAADMVERLRTVRSAVTTVLERVREDKKIGSNLQTAPVVVLGPQWHDVQTDHFAMWCVTSHIHVERVEGAFSMENPGQWMPEEGYVVVGDDMAIKVVLADGEKCHRCWRYLPCVQTRNGEIRESVNGAADQDPDVGVCDRCWSVASRKP